MTRSRSGSFYCVVEPSWAPLSIAQKAAISTAPSTRTPPPPSTPSSQGTLARQKRMEGRSVEPSPSVEMIASPGSRHHHHQRSPASSSLSSITNSLRNVVPFQHKERTTMMVATAVATAAAGIVAGRHKYSPARPSPLRRQVNAPEPLCPSALWISQRELLPLYYPSNSSSQSTSSSSRSSSRGGLRRSVLKSTFLAGPMAEKAKMYGLRVAWCVFGDAKEEMARDIFGPVPQEPPAPVQVTIVEQVEVSDEGLDHVFVEHDETLDSDESSSSDSEYSEEEDDTASEESDDLELDDEDQIEREVYAIFREASFVLDKLPEVTPVPTAVAVDELWEVVQV